MLDNKIKEILQAEKQSEEMIKQASEEGKAMVTNAQIEAEKIRKDTVANAKVERAEVIKLATADAEVEFDKILAEGKEQAEKLSNNVVVEKATEFIIKKVFEKYGNS